MPATVRLNAEEEKALRNKCIEINKLLIKKEKMPLRESELIHIILEKTIRCVKLDQNGEVFIDV